MKFPEQSTKYLLVSMKKRKIALFGGTFDPIHLGHTRVAYTACELIGADKVIFIPAKRSALKEFPPVASDQDRLAMVSLAITDNQKFELSDYEMQKPAPSYTLQTVRHFLNQYDPDIEIHWLIGADSIKDLPHWYQVENLIDECCLSIMCRPGYEIPDFTEFEKLWGNARIEKLRRNAVKTPMVNISSTEVRDRLAKGLDVKDMLNPAVVQYIQQHSLYQIPRN